MPLTAYIFGGIVPRCHGRGIRILRVRPTAGLPCRRPWRSRQATPNWLNGENPMTNKAFRDLTEGTVSPEGRARAATRTRAMLAEMPLHRLRRARELSQAQLAEQLETTQPEVSKIERRTDMYVSTLRNFIQAMGGELEIVARFPDGAVQINQFHDLDPLVP